MSSVAEIAGSGGGQAALTVGAAHGVSRRHVQGRHRRRGQPPGERQRVGQRLGERQRQRRWRSRRRRQERNRWEPSLRSEDRRRGGTSVRSRRAARRSRRRRDRRRGSRARSRRRGVWLFAAAAAEGDPDGLHALSGSRRRPTRSRRSTSRRSISSRATRRTSSRPPRSPSMEVGLLADKLDAELGIACAQIAHDLGNKGDWRSGNEACGAAIKAVHDARAKLGRARRRPRSSFASRCAPSTRRS